MNNDNYKILYGSAAAAAVSPDKGATVQEAHWTPTVIGLRCEAIL